MIKPAVKNQDALKEQTLKEERLLLVTERCGKRIALLLYGGVLLRAFSSSGNDMEEGSVCIGKVSEIKEDIQAVFLRIADGQKCFIHMNELKEEYNLTAKGREFKCGDNFLVQIKKIPSKGKLATATTKLKGFSRKEKEDFYAKALHLSDFSILYDAQYHFIDSIIGEDEAEYPKRIVTDLEDFYPKLVEHIGIKYGALKESVSLYQDKLVSLNVLYGVEGKLSDALSKKVWLKSGGFLYIEPTEAMTVIDVNSGKSSWKDTGEEAVLLQNFEAAEEIARQIVLRNLSGIIIVDFISMKDEGNREKIVNFMKKLLLHDPLKAEVIDITKLDLMEITRKKGNKTIYEQFFG